MVDCKTVATPVVTTSQLSHDRTSILENQDAVLTNVPYREAVGSLMWASIATRPDLTYTVTTLSQFLDKPTQTHWNAVKHVLRYLKATENFKLTYGGAKSGLEGYSDADGMSHAERKAISGYVFLIDGGAISWSSKKQELVSILTTEAEYIATTHAVKEALWLKQFLSELFHPLDHPLPVYCDNQGAIALAHSEPGQYHQAY
jgi:hypothetical protein